MSKLAARNGDWRRTAYAFVVLAASVAACGGEDSPASAGPDTEAAPGGMSDAGTDGSRDAADPLPRGDADSDAGRGDAATHAPSECGVSEGSANPWIQAAFAGVPVLSGTFTSRTSVELPRLVHDASASNGKYGFDLHEAEAPADPRAAFVNVRITDLSSNDSYGGALQTSGAPGAKLYLSNVYIEPRWPAWQDYDTTNYDGMVLDGSAEIYAEDLTVKNWNADSAADIKADIAQFVCLRTEGDGNRTLRFWEPGPHYLVKSSVNNGAGAVVWMRNCTGAKLFVYDSTFNGAAQIPADKISCDEGEDPEIVYLTTDPRTTGEMHPMFSAR